MDSLIIQILSAAGALIIYILTGLNILTFINRKSQKNEINPTLLLLLTAISSFMIVPVILFLIDLFVNKFHTSLNILFTLTLIVSAINYKNIVTSIKNKAFSKQGFPSRLLKDSIFALVLIISLALLEQYLPEYDGYIHENISRYILTEGYSALASKWHYRPGFFYFVASIKLFSPILSIAASKFLLPVVFTLLSLLSFRLFESEKVKLPSRLWVLFLASPLLIAQTIYFRAQSFAMVVLPLAIYCYFMTNNRKFKYFIFALSLIGFVFFHIFFIFIIALSIPFIIQEIGRVYNVWNNKEKALLLAVFLLLLLQIRTMLIPGLTKFFSTYMYFSKLSFNSKLFYLKDYSQDKIGLHYNMTSPELIKFYIYHIIFFALVAISIFFIARKKALTKQNKSTLKILLFIFLFYFSAAELFPRFGVSYDPERIWIFINLTLLTILIVYLSQIEIRRKSLLYFFLILSGIVSYTCIAYQIDARDKTFIKDDHEAINYLNHNYKDFILIGSEVKQPGVNLFQNKDWVYYINFPGALNYEDASKLNFQLDYISRLNDKSFILKKSDPKFAQVITDQISKNQPVNQEDVLRYNEYVENLNKIEPSADAPQRQLFLSICNNIVYCSNPGSSFEKEKEIIQSTKYFEQIYANNSVIVYQYIKNNQPKVDGIDNNIRLLDIIYVSGQETSGLKLSNK